MEEKRIGEITHYFGHLGVAIVKIENEGLVKGDTVRVKGHTSDFTQKVDSMQVDHREVNEVKPGQEAGVKVKEHAREKDEVFKVC